MRVIPRLVSFDTVNKNELFIKVLLDYQNNKMINASDLIKYLVFSNPNVKLKIPLYKYNKNELIFHVDTIGLQKILDSGMSWQLKLGFKLNSDILLVDIQEAANDIYSNNIELINEKNENVSMNIYFDNSKSLSLITTFVHSNDMIVKSIDKIECLDDQIKIFGSVSNNYKGRLWILAIPAFRPEKNQIKMYKLNSSGLHFDVSIPLNELSIEGEYAIQIGAEDEDNLVILDVPFSDAIGFNGVFNIVPMVNNNKSLVFLNPFAFSEQGISTIINDVEIENNIMNILGKIVTERKEVINNLSLESGLLKHRASGYHYSLTNITFDENDLSFLIKIDLQNENYFNLNGVYDFFIKLNRNGITKNFKSLIDELDQESPSYIISPLKNVFTKENVKEIRPYKTLNNTLSFIVRPVESIYEVQKIIKTEKGLEINCKINAPLEIHNISSIELASEQKERKYKIDEYILNDDELNVSLNYDLFEHITRDSYIEDFGVCVTFHIGKNTYTNYLSAKDENEYFYKSYPVYSLDDQNTFVFPFFNKDKKFLLKYGENLHLSVSKIKIDSKHVYFNVIYKNFINHERASLVLFNKEKQEKHDIKIASIESSDKDENSYKITINLSDLIGDYGQEKYKLFLKCSNEDNKEYFLPLIVIDESVISQNNKIKQLINKKNALLFSNINKELLVELTEEDNLLPSSSLKTGKMKNFFARVLAKFTSRFKKNDVWLIGENLGQIARDNGLSFLKYCYESNIPEKYFFVARKNNFDLEKLIPYSDKVVYYDSFKHYYLYHLSKYLIVSHGIRDVMPSFYHSKMRENKKDVIYLQHGVAAMKKLFFNPRSYNGRIRKFVVCSELEKDIFVKNMNFREDQVMITGLSRFDYLKSEDTEEKEILMMPTWREWLLKSDEDFLESSFYKAYNYLLNNKELDKILVENNVKINFVLHVEMLKYAQYFKTSSKNIKISHPEDVDIQKLIRTTKMLITDYSSIAFDFAYQKKPVIFYQFDLDDYLSHRGSYVDMFNDLPGYSTRSEQEFISVFNQIILDNFKSEPKIELRAKRYFEYMDKQNSKRIYNEIKKIR